MPVDRDYSRPCTHGCHAGLIEGTPTGWDGTPGISSHNCSWCEGTGYEKTTAAPNVRDDAWLVRNGFRTPKVVEDERMPTDTIVAISPNDGTMTMTAPDGNQVSIPISDLHFSVSGMHNRIREGAAQLTAMRNGSTAIHGTFQATEINWPVIQEILGSDVITSEEVRAMMCVPEPVLPEEFFNFENRTW